jgi:hypothetical protein
MTIMLTSVVARAGAPRGTKIGTAWCFTDQTKDVPCLWVLEEGSGLFAMWGSTLVQLASPLRAGFYGITISATPTGTTVSEQDAFVLQVVN